MDNIEIDNFCNNITIKNNKAKTYFSLTCDNPLQLDNADPIIEKYQKAFEKNGIKIRIKDRRNHD